MHDVQAVDFCTEENFPGGHPRQDVAPVVDENRPATQLRHATAEAALEVVE
jgi:hypothetical protein